MCTIQHFGMIAIKMLKITPVCLRATTYVRTINTKQIKKQHHWGRKRKEKLTFVLLAYFSFFFQSSRDKPVQTTLQTQMHCTTWRRSTCVLWLCIENLHYKGTGLTSHKQNIWNIHWKYREVSQMTNYHTTNKSTLILGKTHMLHVGSLFFKKS